MKNFLFFSILGILSLIVFTACSLEFATPKTVLTDTRDNLVPGNGIISVNPYDDTVIVFGFGGKPWAVKKDSGTDSDFDTNHANNVLLLYVTQNGTETLYYKTESKEIRIENVSRHAADVSEDGIHFIYVEKNKDTDESTIKFYNDGETEIIYSGDSRLSAFVSPHGTAVAWTYYDENDNSIVNITTGGKTETLGKNLNRISVSDNAEIIFYREEDGKIYVQKGLDRKNRTFIIKSTEENPIFLDYNFDRTQAYYQYEWSDNKYRTYIIVEGEKPVKISDEYTYIPSYSNDISREIPVIDIKKAVWDSSYSGDSDDDSENRIENQLLGLYSDYSTFVIASNVRDYATVNSENVCYYTDNKNFNLYKIDLSNLDNEPIFITDGVPKLVASLDYENLYIINNNAGDLFHLDGFEGLYSVNLSGGKTLIAKTFERILSLGIDKDAVYYFNSGILYKWNGKDSLMIGDFSADYDYDPEIENIHRMTITPDGSFVVLTPSGKDYVSFGGKEFTDLNMLAQRL
jgi:hypothetical protein